MSVPATQFDSREHPVRDQFDAWRDCISVVFDVEPLAADTRGMMLPAPARPERTRDTRGCDGQSSRTKVTFMLTRYSVISPPRTTTFCS